MVIRNVSKPNMFMIVYDFKDTQKEHST